MKEQKERTKMELDSIGIELKRKRTTVYFSFCSAQAIMFSWLKRKAFLPNNKTEVES